MSKWTLFSNHGHVLVVLSRDPDARLRDVAQVVGITERAVQKIVRDLQDGGLISVKKQGRRNSYRLHPNQPLRHTLEAHCTTGELLDMINQRAPGTGSTASEASPGPETGGPETPLPTTLPAEPADREPPETPRVSPDESERTPPEPPDGGDQGSLF